LKSFIDALNRKKLNTICMFVEINHAEEWKILALKPSRFFQEHKAPAVTKHFRSINLAFNQFISRPTALLL